MQDPTQTPATEPTQAGTPQRLTRKPIDLNRIMGTPGPAPQASEPGMDNSWLDMPVSAPEAEMDEPPAWYEDLGESFMAVPRGIANAASAAGNLVNAGARLLPGVDETTFGGMFAPIPTRPLGESAGVGSKITESIVQFGAGFALGGPAVKGAATALGARTLLAEGGGLSLTGGAAAGAVADFTAFDGHAGRMADLIARIPGMEEPMQRYMGGMLTSEEDGEIEGRLKNTLDGLGAGAAVQAIINLARFGRAVSRARAAGKMPEEALAEAHAAVPDVQKSLADLYDMRNADESPFKGQLVDDAVLKARREPVWVNRDGSEAVGFKIMEPAPKPALRDMPDEELAAQLARNLENESKVANDILKRELKFDDGMVSAYLENVRKAREAGPEQAAARAQVEAVRAKLKQRSRGNLIASNTLGEFATEDLQAAIKYKTAAWSERQQPRFVSLAASPKDVDAANAAVLKSWINKYGTLLDNPQTTIKLNPDGTAEIGVAVRHDEITPRLEKLAESIRSSPDMTPRQVGEAALELTRNPPRAPEPPAPTTGGGLPEAVAPASTARRLTPHQIYLGEIGFDSKTADEIGEILQGEFVEGMTARGEVALRFQARGEPFTDAVNPKRMSREELLSSELRRKGMNFEGLKGQPEVLAQSMRTLEKMYVALREAENPLLAKETFGEMSARADSELSAITGIASSYEKSTYLKLAEKVGVEDVNRVGAQAKAAVDFAAGIALDLQAKAAEMFARKQKNIPIQKWEYASWAESRGLAKDALDTASSLRNALARNLYMQRGEIVPAKGAMSRMTAVQLQQDDAALARILMENGGEDKIARDVELIAGSGGRDLHDLAYTLKLAKGTSGMLGVTIEAGYASMLSGLGTPISQMFGNLSTAAYLPLRRAFSAAVHVPFSPNRAALKGEIAESIGTYMAMFRNIPEVMRAYKTGFLHGPTLNPRGGVFDVASRAKTQQITAQNMGLDLESAEGLMVEAVGDLLSIPGRMLQGGDEMARVLMYRTTAQAKLTRLGIESGLEGKALGAAITEDMDRLIYKGQALSLDQLERRAVDQVQREGYTGIHAVERKNRLIAEWQKSDWYKRLSGLSEFASDMGAEASMSKPLDPRTIGGGIQKVLMRHPVLAFTVSPFHKTSVNIATFALQHFDFPAYARWIAESRFNVKGSSLENTTNRFLADMRSGDPIRQAQARGRLVLGTTFASGVAAMYMSGMITGRGPSDRKLRAQMMESGWLPYAIQVNGTYYSYKRLEPIATILGLVADVSQSMEEVPDDRVGDAGDLAMATATALAANLTNKSYAKGLADFTNAITSPGEYLEDWAKSLSTRFVPNVLRDVENIVDPTFSEIRGIHDAMIAKIPYLASDIEPRRNILGEPIQRAKKLGEGAVAALTGSERVGALVSPFSIVQVGQGSDALKQELASLEYAFAMPGSKRGGYDMFDIKASNGQSSYDRWLENTGKIRLGNRTLRQALEATIASPGYQRLSAESLNGEPSARASAVGSVIQRYRRAALLQTQREIPELNQAELGQRIERAKMRAGAR